MISLKISHPTFALLFIYSFATHMYLQVIFPQHAFNALFEVINPPWGCFLRVGPMGIVITAVEISHVDTPSRPFVRLFSFFDKTGPTDINIT